MRRQQGRRERERDNKKTIMIEKQEIKRNSEEDERE